MDNLRQNLLSYDEWVDANDHRNTVNANNTTLSAKPSIVVNPFTSKIEVQGSGNMWIDALQKKQATASNKNILNQYNQYAAGVNQENQYLDNLARGQQISDAFLGQDAFDQAWETQRSSASKDYLDRMRDQSRGLNAQENAAARGQFEAAIRRSGASARNALANNLAGRGMSGGGYANSQRAALEGAIGDQLIGAERQLLLDNVNLQRQGLQNYGSALNQQEGQIRNYLMNNFDIANAYNSTMFDQQMARENNELERRRINASKRRFLGIF